VRVIDRHAPTHHLTGAARSVFGRMSFLYIAGLVYCRHHEEVTVRPSFTGDAAGVGIYNTMFERLRIDLAIIPVRGFRRAVQPLQVILVDGILDHLKKITVDGPCPPRAHTVLSHQHIVSWQQRRR
jgi:hypothetical protein